jgi:hypothetical protein
MFENILVAVDGSKHSDSAFDVAMDSPKIWFPTICTPYFSR